MSLKKRLLALTTVVVMLASSFVAYADTLPTVKTTVLGISEMSSDDLFAENYVGLKVEFENFTGNLDTFNIDVRLPVNFYGHKSSGAGRGPKELTEDNFASYSCTTWNGGANLFNYCTSVIETDEEYNYWKLAAAGVEVDITDTLYLYFIPVDSEGNWDESYVVSADDIVVTASTGRYLGSTTGSIPKIAVKNTSINAAAISGAQASGSDRSWKVVMPLSMLDDAMSTHLYNKTLGVWADTATDLVLKDGVTFTGDGDATITVKTTIKNAANTNDTLGLKFTAGSVESLSPECK